MATREFRHYLTQKVILQGVLVLGVVIAGFLVVQDQVVRFDLTEDDRFSISEYSHELAASLPAPLTIRAYFSDNIPPRIQPLQQQVFDVLAEYEAHGEGRIRIERRDPLTSSAAETEAKGYGVQPVELRVYEATQASALQVYGGIVLLYGDRESEVINIAERYPKGYEGLSALEYEISSRIWQLTNERPKLGITGYLEREAGGGNPFAPQSRPQPEFQNLRRLLGDDFELETVDLAERDVDPEEMPLLLVVRPKEFSDVEVYRLDQYLMRGGRVLMFVTQGTIEAGAMGSQGWSFKTFKTGLDKWLEHNGLRVPNEIVCQRGNALPMQVQVIEEIRGLGKVRVPAIVPNWFFPVISGEVHEEALNPDNPAVRGLQAIVMFWPHPVDVLEDRLAGKSATVLVETHPSESWRWKDLGNVDIRMLANNLDAYQPSSSDLRASPVAVAVEGRFTSFFADRPVPPSLAGGTDAPDGEGDGSEGEEAEDGDASANGEDAAGEEAKKPPLVKESVADTQLVVIGNATFVSDAALSQMSDDQARQTGLLAFNLVDWLARSQELIQLRLKRYTNRMLVDEGYNDYLDDLAEKVKEGEIDEKTYQQRAAEAKERQQARWKAWRWLNILLPCGLVIVAGFTVLIVRRSLRRSGGGPPDLDVSDLPGGE